MCQRCEVDKELLRESAVKISELMETHENLMELLESHDGLDDYTDEERMNGARWLEEVQDTCGMIACRLAILTSHVRADHAPVAIMLGEWAGIAATADPRMLAMILGLDG